MKIVLEWEVSKVESGIKALEIITGKISKRVEKHTKSLNQSNR